MPEIDSHYDAVVVGAGIAGLVCGNYLAKAGLKTLMLEQHYIVGGCCSSFKRKGFTFDSGAHSLGSCRPGGQFDRVLVELGLSGKIDIKRSDPSDSVIANGLRVDFRGSAQEMADGLAQHFPSDRNSARLFFQEIDGFDVNHVRSFVHYYTKYKSATFRDMLNAYFSDEKPKAVLCAFLGNLGLASRQISAMAAIAMFKEFVLDGGYYVSGGMQAFVDFLANNFRKLGGTLLVGMEATKISVKGNRVEGISVRRTRFPQEEPQLIHANHIVSTAGIRQTFSRLIGTESLPRNLAERLPALLPSISSVIVYLGVRGSPVNTSGWGRTVWYSPENNSDEIYGRVFEGGLDKNVELLLLAFPSHYDKTLAPEGCESLYLFTAAPFKDAEFWNTNKTTFRERIIERASELIPKLRDRILVCEAATPLTLYRYTLNDNGALYGLASTPDQLKTRVMPQDTDIEGLYLASHWTTVGAGQGGTPMAAYAGRNAAKLILEKHNSLKTNQRILSEFQQPTIRPPS